VIFTVWGANKLQAQRMPMAAKNNRKSDSLACPTNNRNTGPSGKKSYAQAGMPIAPNMAPIMAAVIDA
jgi:hypothetical protein